ncbi:MAG TPA: bacteriohopanetetrol glucosamine biosynthesis glycosyltransferase HpnI [Candidatus Acidoferrales bacterium]|nr:bacteriohopanetetrol glucosamine biosynthesis glycosyltransferase HpnI [Candidatus Acidoferrales bacterium]
MTARTALFLAIVVFGGTGGEICVSRAMKRIGEVHEFSPRALLQVMMRAFSQGFLWLGIALMAVSFFSLLALLSWAPLSFVKPASALSYAVGVMGGKFLLGERVSASRWRGVSLVCVGVGLTCVGNMGTLWHGRAVIEALRWLVLGLAALPLLYYLAASLAAWSFFREKRRGESEGSEFAPPASVLKPVRGLDREAYENFASFCRQDYPEYEILFAVSDADDPAVPVIQKLMADFPERKIRLLIGDAFPGINNKAAKLRRLADEARHDVYVISDSDVRVAPGYLRAVCAAFRDPGVGGVTCLYRGLAERQLGAELEAIGITSDFLAGVLMARKLEGIKFMLGATMATTRERLAEIGGFEALADLLADDYELGKRIAERGRRIELLAEPVSTICPAQSVRSYFKHQLRWARAVRLSRPGGYAGLLLTFGLPWSVAAAAVAPSAGVAVGFLGGYVLLRGLMAWTVGVWGLKDVLLRRRLWMVPLRDAIAFLVWLASFASNRVHWRGMEFKVKNNRMVAVGTGTGRS